MNVTDVLAAAAILLGVALFVIAGIGLHRFDDVFARMHVATKPATLGLLLILTGAGLRVQDGGDIAKLVLVAGLQLITAPMAAHIIGRAAHRAKVPMSPTLTTDDLAEAGDWPQENEKSDLRSGSAGAQE